MLAASDGLGEGAMVEVGDWGLRADTAHPRPSDWAASWGEAARADLGGLVVAAHRWARCITSAAFTVHLSLHIGMEEQRMRRWWAH